jgi:hypothetical protein
MLDEYTPTPRSPQIGTGGRETLASNTASWRTGSAASPRSVGFLAPKGNRSASPGAMTPERITLAAALLHPDRGDWPLPALLALAPLIMLLPMPKNIQHAALSVAGQRVMRQIENRAAITRRELELELAPSAEVGGLSLRQAVLQAAQQRAALKAANARRRGSMAGSGPLAVDWRAGAVMRGR